MSRIIVAENNVVSLTVNVVTRANGVDTAYDLTGKSAEMYVKTKTSDADGAALATYTVANGKITVTSAAGGVLTVTIDAAATATPGEYVFHLDVTRTTPALRVTVLAGELIVTDV